MKTYKDFQNEEMTEMSPRSQKIAHLTYKAEGQLILVKHKGGWKIMDNDKVVIVK